MKTGEAFYGEALYYGLQVKNKPISYLDLAMKPYLKTLLTICLIHIASLAFAQKHSFSHYKVPLYKGRPAKLKIKGNPLAEMFHTIIKDTYYSNKEMIRWRGTTGLNFAGHYCFVYWGCGSNCQDSAVVDLETGIVYPGITAEMGYEFKRNSRLVIVNPGQTKDSCAFCASRYLVWNVKDKTFNKIR
ncbi:MAG: hypothetical protein ACTHJ8_12350 [Mucilaginibacter sp.]